MGDGFDVSTDEVRAHAAAVEGIADQVASARPSAQVGADSFGSIATFFASAITSAGDLVGDAITGGAQAVTGVQAGLKATAAVYDQFEDATVQRFRVDGGSATRGLVPAKLGGQPKPQQGQRAKAVAVLEKISRENPVSAATVALRQVKWLHGWAGDFASASIGDHYEKDVPHLLKRPPTDANLRLLADTETKFWNSDEGNLAGRLMSADTRYNYLVEARTEWLNEMAPADRARIAQQLGVRLGN